jgi:hypothetical protein
MYQNEIQNLPRLEDYNFENIFKIYKDNDHYFYNLLKTINFPRDLDPVYFETYRVKSNMALTILSYKFYGTIKLWWLILLTNQINNPIAFINPGKMLKIIKPAYVGDILQSIKESLK